MGLVRIDPSRGFRGGSCFQRIRGRNGSIWEGHVTSHKSCPIFWGTNWRVQVEVECCIDMSGWQVSGAGKGHYGQSVRPYNTMHGVMESGSKGIRSCRSWRSLRLAQLCLPGGCWERSCWWKTQLSAAKQRVADPNLGKIGFHPGSNC